MRQKRQLTGPGLSCHILPSPNTRGTARSNGEGHLGLVDHQVRRIYLDLEGPAAVRLSPENRPVGQQILARRSQANSHVVKSEVELAIRIVSQDQPALDIEVRTSVGVDDSEFTLLECYKTLGQGMRSSDDDARVS